MGLKTRLTIFLAFIPKNMLFDGVQQTKEGNELDVVVNILSLAGKGADKTEIMRRCSLKPDVLEKYLFALTELSLLKVEEKSETLYRTSDKGLQLLRTYYRLKWLLWGDSFDFLLLRLLGRLSRRIEHKPSNLHKFAYIY